MKKILLALFLSITILISIFHLVLAIEKDEVLEEKLAKYSADNELIHLRTENRRSFKDKNGQMVTFLSTDPLNYFDDNQQLQPIETSLTTEPSFKSGKSQRSANKNIDRTNVEKSKYPHAALKNSIQARFADFSDGGVLYKYKNEKIEFVLNHKNKRQAKIHKNKIRYEKIFDNCDLEYTVLPGKVKDELIFYSVPKTPVISFKVNFNQLKPKNGANGGVDLVNESGERIFSVLPSVMFEQGNPETEKFVETKFHWEDNQLYCDLILDMSWLKSKKRKYPIVVDPVVVPPLSSQSKQEVRFRLHAPENYSQITCEARVTGPEYHGHLGSHTKAQFHYKDLTSGEVFDSYSGLNNYYSKKPAIALQAGHDYEVYIKGGKAKNVLGTKYEGYAWAQITYGDDNLRLFPAVPERTFKTIVTDTLQKVIEISYPQQITYTYTDENAISNSSGIPYLRIYHEGSSTPIYDLQPGQGKFNLSVGKYRVILSPGLMHSRVNLTFPRGTANYESKIEMRTNPGMIDSTFMVPYDSEVLLQYRTSRNGNPSSEAYPIVKIIGETGLLIERQYDLGFYNNFDGGDKVFLKKEQPYHLIVSRGRSGNSGWGHIDLDLYHAANHPCSATNLRLVDGSGNPTTLLYGGNNYKLHFDYLDQDLNTLKEYKLIVTQSNPELHKEFLIQKLNISNQEVSIPFSIKDLGLTEGAVTTCRVEVWDGFDTVQMLNDFVFTVDNTPPEIELFTGEVKSDDNSISIQCQARDLLSGLLKKEIRWKINGQNVGSRELAKTDKNYLISDLPSNARVEVILHVEDAIGNINEKNLIFYTYPDKATLVAPAAAASNQRNLLKIGKADAAYMKVERYRGSVSEATKDYDTGYFDPATMNLGTVGAPQVTLTGPPYGSTYSQPANIYLSADAYDVDGRIAKVSFYANQTLIGTTTRSPYNFTWKNVPAGTYEITAKAVDDDGLETESRPFRLTVKNSLPVVTITNPLGGTTYEPKSNITINANAFDSDGSVEKVEFYANNNLIGTDYASPFSIQWENVPVGTYTLVAKATDNNGDISSSNPISIKVVPPPIGPYRFNFNCHQERRGIYNLFHLYLPAKLPPAGTYNYGALGKSGVLWINESSHITPIPYALRVKYVFSVENKKDKDERTPYFQVILNGTQQLVYESFYNDTRSGEFIIPANAYVLINMESGKTVDKDTLDDNDKYGYNCWYGLTFEYILPETVLKTLTQSTVTASEIFTPSSENLLNSVKTINEDNINTEQQYYTLLEPEPAQSHQNYIYRIYTKNGDKEVYTDTAVAVANGVPEIRGINPERDKTAHCNGTFRIEIPEVYDDDGDELKFIYQLSGVSNSDETSAREYQWTNLPDGEYTWTVTAKDSYGGSSNVSGKVIVDKALPVVSFKINDYQQYTNNRQVKINIFGYSDNTNIVRISNDKTNWQEVNFRELVSWELPDQDGLRTVYLQAQNSAGVWGPIIEQSITLDRVKPDLTNFKITNQGRTNQVYFRWTGASDGLSSIAGYNIEGWNGTNWDRLQTVYPQDNLIMNVTGYNAPVRMRVQAVDQAGNLSDWIESTGYTKAAAGSINLLESISGYNDNDGYFVELKLNPAQGGVKYKLICVEDNGGGDTVVLDGQTTSYRDTGLVKHGLYKYKVYTYNNNDEITENDTEYTINIANRIPEKPVCLGPQGFVADINNLILTFDRSIDSIDPDGDPITTQYFLSTDGITYQLQDSSLLNDLTDGKTYWWKARFDDGYGGVVETDPVSFTVDITAPTLTVDNRSIQYATEHKVHLQLSESGSGIASIKINGVDTPEIPAEITFNQQGENPLHIEVKDKAGNVTEFNHIYRVDQTAPVLTNLKFTLAQHNGKYLASGSPIPTEWNGVDPETGIAQFYYAWSTNNGSFDPADIKTISLVGGLENYVANLNGEFIDGETYYLHLQPENYLGLKGSIYHSPALFYDHTAPVLTWNGLTGGRVFNGNTIYSSINDLNADYQADDPHSGISRTEFALVETKEEENVNWFETLEALKGNFSIVPGKTYFLAVRVYNGTNLAATTFSEPLIIDNSAPGLTIISQAEQRDNQCYQGSVKISEDETLVSKLMYAIGSTPGGTDLSLKLAGADANGWFTLTYPANQVDIRQYSQIPVGTTYYITVKAENIAGLTRTVISSGTKIIENDAPVVFDEGQYSANANELSFSWNLANPAGTVRNYQYRIRIESQVVKSWAETNTTSIKETLPLENGQIYYCDVRAKFENGEMSEVGTSDGIIIDTTLPQITHFETPRFSDGRGISIQWAANDPESGFKAYAGISTTPGAADLTKGWIPIGNLNKYYLTSDNLGQPLQLEDGQRYYVTLYVINGAGSVVQQTSDSVLIDQTPPPTPIVIDEGNYSNRNDFLKFSWKWPNDDPESGIKEYWYTLTTERAINGGEEWYTSLQEREIVLEDLELDQGQTYYLAVKAINNAGLEQIGFSDGILIDITAPSLPQVVDFGDYSLSKTKLDVSVVASDAESGIGSYQLSLGTAQNPEAIIKNRVVLANGGVENLTLEGLSLNEGEVYYFTVTATNQAGLTSMLSTSDGIMVDTQLPNVSEVSVSGRFISDPSRISFSWKAAATPSGIFDAQYAISEDPNGTNLNWLPASLLGTQTVTGLNLKENTTYYVFVRVQNRALAENTPGTWSVPGRSNPVTVDMTPPVVKIVTPGNGMAGQNFPLQWEAIETVSGINEYRYAIGTSPGGTDLTNGWVSVVTDQNEVKFTRNDLPLVNNRIYYISVIARNGAGLWSEMAKSSGIKTELTPPVVTKLEYNGVYLRSTGTIKGISWAGVDEETGIIAYRVQLVQEKDGLPLSTPAIAVSQPYGTFDLTNLGLKENQVYYIALQVQNGVGSWSEVKYSQPITVDATPPVVTISEAAPEMVTNSGQLVVKWQASELGKAKIELIHPHGKMESVEVEMSLDNQYQFDQSVEGRYTLRIISEDLAGNFGDVVTQVIRLNAKPSVNLGPDRIATKGTKIQFIPEVSDVDGIITGYKWDFGNGETSVEAQPSCIYENVGKYQVILTVQDNDGKWSEPATVMVTITNTTSGQLNADEDWDGNIQLTGDVIIPKGVILTVKAGTKITLTGNYGIHVYGVLKIDGEDGKPVVITSPGNWKGIRFENAESGSIVNYARIENGLVGIAALGCNLEISNSEFKHNRIGIHVIAASPLIQNCTVEENTVYGIKEDDAANPRVIGCIIQNNGVANYYEDMKAIISIETLNELGSNRDNR